MAAANYSYCELTGYETDQDWQSNHCAFEGWAWWLGQVILFISYFAGYLSVAYGLRRYKHVFAMRAGILLSAIILLIWAGEQAKARDQIAYQVIIMIVNLAHMAYIYIHDGRPITLNDYLHNLWYKMFNMNGYNLELMDFYNLMQEKAFLKTYKKGQTYIAEGDYPQQLSILLSGKMSVYKRDDWQRKSLYMAHQSTAVERRKEERDIQNENAFCGTVYPYEFIDSYEWLMCQGVFKYEGLSAPAMSGTSQVTIKVSDEDMTTECVVLTWKKEMLEAVFKEHPRLRVCIHSLVGKDIADKMLRICGHSVRPLQPDVDMVRKAHALWRPTMRVDVKHAHQTDVERSVLPVPSNRAACILDDVYTIEDAEGNEKKFQNMTDTQTRLKQCIGAGPWCDLPDAELKEMPWRHAPDFMEQKGSGDSWDLKIGEIDDSKRPLEDELHHHLLEQAMHSLQRARLRVTNARMLGMNPGALEALQPSSDVNEQNKIHGAQLLRYFDENIPELKKKDLHEILKWGRWRTYYRPGTCLVRQGEEAHYVGLVLQGRLALYTEDEITRTKSLVTTVDKFDLVGSEDFSSKFRTARRTIQMPAYKRSDDRDPDDLLPKTIFDEPWEGDEEKKREAYMYEKMSPDKANEWAETQALSAADHEYLQQQIANARRIDKEDPADILVTKIPTVLFMWDIKDLKRLMLADPHVESSLSTLLRSDITFKLNSAAPSALGTRLCGVPTMARGDQDIRMCAVTSE
jgi:CRP-like cAMP-binding protein